MTMTVYTQEQMTEYLVKKGHAMKRNDQAQLDRLAIYYGFEGFENPDNPKEVNYLKL